jgi:hypothetical protein
MGSQHGAWMGSSHRSDVRSSGGSRGWKSTHQAFGFANVFIAIRQLRLPPAPGGIKPNATDDAEVESGWQHHEDGFVIEMDR